MDEHDCSHELHEVILIIGAPILVTRCSNGVLGVQVIIRVVSLPRLLLSLLRYLGLFLLLQRKGQKVILKGWEGYKSDDALALYGHQDPCSWRPSELPPSLLAGLESVRIWSCLSG